MRKPIIPGKHGGLLIIRADANVHIGTGHVMRCLALAQEWRRGGGRVIFAQAETTAALKQKLRNEKMQLRAIKASIGSAADAKEIISLAHQAQVSCIVADGYRFGANYQKRIKDAGLKMLLVDDYGHAKSYSADFVLNQNLSASESFYRKRSQDTRLLLGPKYVMLRREFSAWRKWPRKIPATASRVLVTLGGSDSKNLSTRLIVAMDKLPQVNLVVVAGAANPHLRQLYAAVRQRAPRVQLVSHAANMPELMAGADVAITAGGSTTWELAFMGLPSLVFVTAKNQAGIAAMLDKQGVSRLLSSEPRGFSQRITSALKSLVENRELRRAMSRRGRQLIDGRGTLRIVQLLSTRARHALSPTN